MLNAAFSKTLQHDKSGLVYCQTNGRFTAWNCIYTFLSSVVFYSVFSEARCSAYLIFRH